MKTGNSTSRPSVPDLQGLFDSSQPGNAGPGSQVMVDRPTRPRAPTHGTTATPSGVSKLSTAQVLPPERDEPGREALEWSARNLKYAKYEPDFRDRVWEIARVRQTPDEAMSFANECLDRAQMTPSTSGYFGKRATETLLEIAAQLLESVVHPGTAAAQARLTGMLIDAVHGGHTNCLQLAITHVRGASEDVRPNLEWRLVRAINAYFISQTATHSESGPLFGLDAATLEWVLPKMNGRALSEMVVRLFDGAREVADSPKRIRMFADVATSAGFGDVLIGKAISRLVGLLEQERDWLIQDVKPHPHGFCLTPQEWHSTFVKVLDGILYGLGKMSAEALQAPFQKTCRLVGSLQVFIGARVAEALLDFPLDDQSKAALLATTTSARGFVRHQPEFAPSAAIISFLLDPMGTVIDPATSAPFHYSADVLRCREILRTSFPRTEATDRRGAVIDEAANLSQDISALVAQYDGPTLRSDMRLTIEAHLASGAA